jgi:hypothetical protein
MSRLFISAVIGPFLVVSRIALGQDDKSTVLIQRTRTFRRPIPAHPRPSNCRLYLLVQRRQTRTTFRSGLVCVPRGS